MNFLPSGYLLAPSASFFGPELAELSSFKVGAYSIINYLFFFHWRSVPTTEPAHVDRILHANRLRLSAADLVEN
jgi:hypothetical protein